jgi:hypothetical protein
MAWFDSRTYARAASSRAGKMLVLGVSVVTLVGLSVLVTGGFAESPNEASSIVAQAKKKGFVPVCTQRSGHNQSKGDLNVRLRKFCAKGQKPLKLATWPVKGKRGPQGPQGPQGPPGPPSADGPAAEYGVANVFVDKETGNPVRYATYSVELGSPVGTSTGGQFRFTCTAAQSPCRVSLKAAVLSARSGEALVYPRVLIHRQDSGSSPMTYCEYANGGVNRVSRVELGTGADEIRETLTMNIGGSLDCGSNQPYRQRVDEIWVTNGSTDTAHYDVWTTVNFGRGS